MQLRAWRVEDDHGDAVSLCVLLESEVAVAGHFHEQRIFKAGEIAGPTLEFITQVSHARVLDLPRPQWRD